MNYDNANESLTAPQEAGEGVKADFARRFSPSSVVRVEGLQTPGGAGVTVLFGASGSGKTTVLRCLAGLERPDEGTIQFEGTVWSDARGGTFVAPQQRRVGFVPQDYALFPHLTVERNISYGTHDLAVGQRHEQVARMVAWLGLEGLEKRLPNELSGGQQQRVALARAVACRPRLLLLDEPLSALDAPTRGRLRVELRQLLVTLGIPTFLVTHDRDEALSLGDQLVIMDRGRVLQQGPVQEVFSRPCSIAAAGAVAIETVQRGRVSAVREGLIFLDVNGVGLTAVCGQEMHAGDSVFVCIRAEDVVLIQKDGMATSARNRLAGTVRALEKDGFMVRVQIECGFPLTALLTQQACAELNVSVNGHVLALIKAPQIHLIPHLEAR
jgi:molybdate transport system ATP-binding protein